MGTGFDPPPSPMVAGLACRCPRCGRGHLFRGYLTVTDHCPVCDLHLADHDTGDGPAVFVIFILGAVVVPLALWVEAVFEPPLWLHAALWSAAVMGGTLALLRPLKGLLVALHYRHRSPGT